MKRLRASSKGFTILELLVVITVIAILATIMVVSYDGIQQRARDAQRASDVTQLKIALEKYFAANSQYPAPCADGTGCPVSSLSTLLAPYIQAIPHDPKAVSDSFEDYGYVRGGTSGNAYGIKVDYETKPECKTGVRINPDWWETTTPVCS